MSKSPDSTSSSASGSKASAGHSFSASSPSSSGDNSILVVGSVAFDTIRAPAGVAEGVLGGAANYFSVAASFFAPVKVIAVVGEDFPKAHLSWLASRKVDTSGIQIAAGKTFHWVGSYEDSFNEAKTLSTALNVFATFKPKLDTHHKNSPYVFLANIDPVLQLEVLDQVAKPRFVACDTMNFWIGGKLDELKQTLKRVDLLSINETETYLLSGQKNLLRAAEAVLGMGPRFLIVKRGEYGSVFFSKYGTFLAPAFPVGQVVDPTGAGDSFAGAMMGYLAEAGIDRDLADRDPARFDDILRRAVLTGGVLASFTVEDFSLNRLIRLTKEELVARQNQLYKMIRLD